jgi:hypothetical protein
MPLAADVNLPDIAAKSQGTTLSLFFLKGLSRHDLSFFFYKALLRS